ncbi:TolC family protein [Hydrogenophaga sp.]|uniref:TolC family protein n=1 Tax=Hydrogenophaga sp. TaxID=1904254 RepID=UPI00286E537E|nr:TolC family protein [Hydrogenophaga sp.]
MQVSDARLLRVKACVGSILGRRPWAAAGSSSLGGLGGLGGLGVLGMGVVRRGWRPWVLLAALGAAVSPALHAQGRSPSAAVASDLVSQTAPAMSAVTATVAQVAPETLAQAGRQTTQPLRLGPVELAQLLALRNLELAYGRDSVRVAELLAQAEQALYEPTLFVSAREARNLRQRTVEEWNSDNLIRFDRQLKEESTNLELGVRQRLPSGGELALSARQSQRSSNILAKAGTEREVNSGLVLTFKQPLLRGSGRQATETDRRVAEIEAVVTQWQFRQQLQKVTAEGLSLFWQAYVANESVRLRRALTRSAESMLEDAQARLEAGRLAPRLVNEARRLLLQRQSEALRAEQSRDEVLLRLLSSVDLPHQRLNDLQLLAQPDAAVAGSSEPAAVVDDRLALSQWAPYRIAALRQQQGQVRLAFAENQQRPAMDLVVSHTQTGLADTTGSLGIARSGRFPEWYVGVNIELGAYGNGRARAQTQAQLLRLQQSETELHAIEQTFSNDLRAKRDALRALEQEHGLVKNDLNARAQFFAQEQQRVALGVAALFSQIQAEQDLLEAEIRLVDVSGRRETARLALQLAEGGLLQAHAVENPLPGEP